MMTSIQSKLKDVWRWTKKAWKEFLIALGILTVAVAGIGGVDIQESYPTAQTPDGTIEFHNDNMIEQNGFDLRSDKHDYGGDTEVTNYLYLKNTSGQDLNNIAVKPKVRRNEMRIKNVKRLVEDIEYEYEDVVSTSTHIHGTESSSTEHIHEELGTVTSTRDEWQPIAFENIKRPDLDNTKFRGDDFFPPNQFKVDLNAGEVAVLKVKLNTHAEWRNDAEPYLWEAKKGQYIALLDPQVDTSQWSHYFSITATSTITGTHTDFPLYYNGVNAPADCTSNLKADGTDIRVTTSTPDGGNVNALDHELVSATTTAGSWEIYFRDPSLAASDKYFVLCGNGSATDTSTSSTWNANYKGVWHSSTSTDSTSNSNDGTFNGDLPTTVSGQIGDAQDYDGTNDYIEVSANSDFDVSDFTVSFWFDSDDIEAENNIGMFSYEDASFTSPRFSIGNINPGNVFGISLRDDSGATRNATFTHDGILTNDTWFYTSVTRNSSTNEMNVIINDTQRASNTDTFTYSGNSGNPITIGTRVNQTEDYNGTLDEIRFVSTALSSSTIDAEYKNQNNPSSFWSVGTATSTAAAPAAPAVRGNVNWW